MDLVTMYKDGLVATVDKHTKTYDVFLDAGWLLQNQVTELTNEDTKPQEQDVSKRQYKKKTSTE